MPSGGGERTELTAGGHSEERPGRGGSPRSKERTCSTSARSARMLSAASSAAFSDSALLSAAAAASSSFPSNSYCIITLI